MSSWRCVRARCAARTPQNTSPDAPEAGCSPATLYTILAKFEKEKYIRETAVDGRKRTYAITEKGLAAYDAELLRLRRCLTDAERQSAQAKEA